MKARAYGRCGWGGRAFAVAAVLVMHSAAALAQDGSSAAGAEPEEPPALDPPPAPPFETPPPPEVERHFHFTIRGLGETAFRADIDGLPADVAVHRSGLGVGMSGALTERLRLSVNLDGELSWYEFRDAFGILNDSRDPVPDAWRVVLRPQLAIIETMQRSWFVGGIVEAAGVSGANFGDSITGGGFGGVRYQVTENLALSLGVAAKTRLEESALVVPLIGLEWDVGRESAGPGGSERRGLRVETEGLGGRLTAPFTDEWAFRFTAGWEIREYRLPDSGPLPEGVARDWRVPIGAGFVWTPRPNIGVELLGGVIAWQEYRFDDAGGNRIAEVNTDPTPFLRISGRITF